MNENLLNFSFEWEKKMYGGEKVTLTIVRAIRKLPSRVFFWRVGDRGLLTFDYEKEENGVFF